MSVETVIATVPTTVPAVPAADTASDTAVSPLAVDAGPFVGDTGPRGVIALPATRAAAPAFIDEEVRRIVVLRALVLGDMICAVPALRAIRRAWPQAHIALLGLQVARVYLSRLDCVDEWLAFPGWPGMPEREVDVHALPAFLIGMQASSWDLAIQLHGSGGLSNSLMTIFGARWHAGFQGASVWAPPADMRRFAPWPLHGTESERLLSLCHHLGLPIDDVGLEFPLRIEDDDALQRAWPGRERAGAYACLHVGAQLPSRRWPLQRFAEAALALHDAGLTLVLTGTDAERPLTRELSTLLAARGVPSVDLAGATTLWTLGALLRDARVLLCNDTGVSHIAAALRVPSVVLSCGSDPDRWAPSDRSLHRVLAKPAPCRPCAYVECPHGHACALALSVVEVVQALQALLREPRRPSAPPPRHATTQPPHEEGNHAPSPAHPDLARPRQLPLQPHAGAA